MARRCAEGIIPNLPVHVTAVSQEPAEGQTLKRKNALRCEQTIEPGTQKHVQVKVESAEMKHREISEKVVPLDSKGERFENGSILREFGIDEPFDVLIRKKDVLKIRIEEFEVRNCGALFQREIAVLTGLDDAFGNHVDA